MGTQFLCQRLAIPKDKTPDWDAGIQAAMAFVPEYNDPNWDHWGEGRNAMFCIRRQLHSDIQVLRRYWEGSAYRDDTDDFEVGSYQVIVSGGIAVGGPMSTMYELIERLVTSEIADAMGFE